MELQTYLKINPADTVVVCLTEKKRGDVIEAGDERVVLAQDVPAGHKVLLRDVKAGENIIKYGYPIGHAIKDMKGGEWVNENNLKTNLSGTLEYTYEPVSEKLNIQNDHRTFKGYIRKNGDVGVRNEIWIVPTVGCVNGRQHLCLAPQLRVLAVEWRPREHSQDSARHRASSQCWCSIGGGTRLREQPTR